MLTQEFKRHIIETIKNCLRNKFQNNPYFPKPYSRWTMKGMLDLKNEVKVAEEFWDFLSGEDTHNDLLECFEVSGIELRSEIDEYFKIFL